MKRLTIIKIHLFFSAPVLIFLCLTAVSGALHLLKGSEAEEVIEVKSIGLDRKLDKKELENLFSEQLKVINPNYKYEYMKGSESSQVSRPQTRTYYSISANESSAIVKKHVPSLLKSLMEMHQGHGPRISKTILGILGFFVVGALITGIWLALTSPPLKKFALLALVSGGVIYSALFMI